MSDRVRVGLVGVGIIAETHLAVLAERPEVHLEFTADPRLAEPPEFRGSRPPHYASLGGALDAHRPDLIVIATPTATHADLVALALTRSPARVLVEKPLVHDLASLARLDAPDGSDGADAADAADGVAGVAGARGRVFTAHHFAFSPEVLWAAEQIAAHEEWGPVTGITSAFHDPYVLRGEDAFVSYVSSWTDSGVNQLSMLSRFVDLTALVSVRQMDGGASAWCVCEYLSRGEVGRARLRTSWLAGASSKETVLVLGDSDVEIWIDHTAMTGFVARAGELLATHGDDGRTPRKIAHYRPLYESLLSDRPDPVLGFDVATTITELYHATPSGQVPDDAVR